MAKTRGSKSTVSKAKNSAGSTNEVKLLKAEIVRGMPKSGRFWKTTKERTSSIIKSKRKEGVVKLKKLQEEKIRVKQLSKAIRDTRRAESDAKREREATNKTRRDENARKSEIVQVIKNTAKLKRMKKKQLKKVQKRDTTVIEKDKPAKKARAEPAAAAVEMETS